jgi:hypothetical protein
MGRRRRRGRRRKRYVVPRQGTSLLHLVKIVWFGEKETKIIILHGGRYIFHV